MKRNYLIFHCLFLFSLQVEAATTCVDDSLSFETALELAAVNNQSDHIQIARDVSLVSIEGFVYDGEFEAYDFKISGGWYEGLENREQFSGNIFCNAQTDKFAASTIDGDGKYRGLIIKAHPSSKVEVSNILFENGDASSGAGAGLFIDNGDVTIQKNVFFNNSAALGGAAIFLNNGNKYVIRNNMITDNHSTIFAGAVSIFSQDNTTGVYFTNNNVVNNTTSSTSTSASSGINITVEGSAKAYIGNNILWNNDHNDIVMGGTGYKYLMNNDIASISGQMADFESGNISQTPIFIFIDTHQYLPRAPSFLVNTGRHPLDPIEHPTFDNQRTLGEFDVREEARVQGNRVDMGAFETSDIIFKNSFSANIEL